MLKAFRVKNLRSIVDSGLLEIKPIVAFVGKNSSGKSTLLRLFPLLKQSVSEDTREPILWYGRSVDFGSFDEALNQKSEDKEITFEFRFDIKRVAGQELVVSEGGEQFFWQINQPRSLFLNDRMKDVDISISVRKRADSDGTYVRSIAVQVGKDVIQLFAGEDGTLEPPIFNGRAFLETPSVRLQFAKGRFFPALVPAVAEETNPTTTQQMVRLVSHGGGQYARLLIKLLRPYVHGNTQESSLEKLATSLAFGHKEEFFDSLKQKAGSKKSKLRLEHILHASWQQIDDIRGAVLLRDVAGIFREASSQLAKLGAGVRYLEPVRATASRYYRFQELAIDEIDPQGGNVPMFLSSLSYFEQQELQKWMSDALGFQVRATRTGGHAKLLIQEVGSTEETNLADTGFGYSQILPIVLQLWRMGRDSRRVTPRRTPPQQQQQIVAVEQPELHLHPHFQALLGDLFALSINASRDTVGGLSLVVETHSEHLINRLGALVEKGVLSSDDIVIYLVQRDPRTAITTVQKTTFNSAGSLEDPWPFGFFSPNLQ